MDVQCAICGRTADTKKEEITGTTGWVLDEVAKLNNVNHEEAFPRVSMICPDCWNKVLKKKTEDKTCFWNYNKEI